MKVKSFQIHYCFQKSRNPRNDSELSIRAGSVCNCSILYWPHSHTNARWDCEQKKMDIFSRLHNENMIYVLHIWYIKLMIFHNTSDYEYRQKSLNTGEGKKEGHLYDYSSCHYVFLEVREYFFLKYLQSYSRPFASIWQTKFANWPSLSIRDCLERSGTVHYSGGTTWSGGGGPILQFFS